jgi:RAT1-interacting protein
MLRLDVALEIEADIAQEIACFSYDDQHRYRADASGLRYYYTPRIGANLCRGFERFQKLDDSADEHLEALLRTLVAHEQETGRKTEAQVITWRGMMTKLMAAPFTDRDGYGLWPEGGEERERGG